MDEIVHAKILQFSLDMDDAAMNLDFVVFLLRVMVPPTPRKQLIY